MHLKAQNLHWIIKVFVNTTKIVGGKAALGWDTWPQDTNH